MIRTRDIMACLPLLASILGDRYGVKVVIGGREARTDGDTIYLPTLPLDCDETLLALARGYCDHEAAHIRHTDFTALRLAKLTPMQAHLWNAIEDWRVEALLAALFPGCRPHFQRLIREFFGEDDGAGTNPALSVLHWVLLTVRAWELPEIGRQRDREAAVLDSAFPGLRPKLEAVLVRTRQCCRSTGEAIAYALELAAIIEKYAQQPQEKTPDTPDKTVKQDGQGAAQPGQGGSSVGGTDAASQSEETGNTDAEAQSRKAVQSPHPLKGLLQASVDDLPKHLGERMAESLSALREKNAQHGLSVAKVGYKNTRELPDDLREEALQSCVALRTRLQALLQARAQKPCVTGRRGKLHTQRLYALAVNNPRVFIKPGEKLSASTAVHLLLDCSGSMQGPRMTLASLACYAAARALEGCKGVNVGVTLFPADSPASPTHPDGATVAPLVRHGERPHQNFSVYSGGDTPLAESLWWVMQRMYPLREERKIILVLSDGMPDSFQAARHVMDRGKALGFEILGLGIQDTSMSRLLPNASRTIENLPSLAPAMFDMLQQALLRQEGGRS